MFPPGQFFRNQQAKGYDYSKSLKSSSGDYKLVIARIYKLYQSKLFDANAVDFDDIINLTVKLFMDFQTC